MLLSKAHGDAIPRLMLWVGQDAPPRCPPLSVAQRPGPAAGAVAGDAAATFEYMAVIERRFSGQRCMAAVLLGRGGMAVSTGLPIPVITGSGGQGATSCFAVA